MQIQPIETLDLQGLKCPLPVLKTQKRMKNMSSGEQLIVKTTDPLADLDITHFCQEHGHKIIKKSGQKDNLSFTIEKK